MIDYISFCITDFYLVHILSLRNCQFYELIRNVFLLCLFFSAIVFIFEAFFHMSIMFFFCAVDLSLESQSGQAKNL